MARRNLEAVLGSVFSDHGYHEVVTPGLEYYDVFSLGSAGIPQEAMYKLSDHKGRLMVLRPDNTLPIARLTATRLKNELLPIRLYYTQTVYQSHPSLTGRNNEIMQTGIELLGKSGKRADLETIAVATEALGRCASDFRIELGHAGFFRALASELPISDEVREDIRTSIESKNYGALDAILDTLKETPAVTAIRCLPRLFGGEEVFEIARKLCPGEEARMPLDYLEELYRSLVQLGLGHRLMIDLGLVQRNDYYSDIVFSGYVQGSGDAVLSGGRYDRLLESFEAPMPAVGFGINVDALTKIMLDSGNAQPFPKPAVLVHGEEGFELAALNHASYLRNCGIRCENSVFETRGQALSYARAKEIDRVDFVAQMVETVYIFKE